MMKDKNPEPQLPPETQTGANTFGCRVTGQVWTYKPSTNPGHIGLDADYSGGGMYVLAKRGDTAIKIDFSSGGITQLGEYMLYTDSSEIYYAVNPVPYYTDSVTNGILTMTRIDTVNSILSGRFYFTGISYLGDTVRITDGRFDVKFRYP